jgi:hypothetical protein
MRGTEGRQRPEDSTRPHHVVVLEEPGVADRSLYLGSLGQEQNCCDWRGAGNDSRGRGRIQGLHRQEGNYAWEIKGSHKMKGRAWRNKRYSERFQSEKGMGGR